MTTLSFCLVGKNEWNYFLNECIQSILPIADEIIYVDTGSSDGTPEKLREKYPQIKIFEAKMESAYDYSTVRNFAISKATSEWIWNLDCDEVLSDQIVLFKKFLEDTARESFDSFDIKGEHFIYHLFAVDATIRDHYWLRRVIKNIPEIRYPENTMHGLPTGCKKTARIKRTLIYHYGYVKNSVDNLRRYTTNKEKLEMHSADFLKMWIQAHLMGKYPVTMFIEKHPTPIYKKFFMDEWVDWDSYKLGEITNTNG